MFFYQSCNLYIGLHKFGTMHVMRMQVALHMHKNLCALLIPLCKNNLNLPMFSFFCPLFGCLFLLSIMMSCLLPRCGVLIFLFVCFYRERFYSQSKTRYLLVNLKAGFHSSNFADGKIVIEWVCWVYVYINYTIGFQNYTNICIC